MQKIFRKLKKDHSGSSMVVVIIALAFVGILAATIMWMALNNYRMKATDTQHKRSFYAAEIVMEQIVAGVQTEASKAIDVAYQNVMQQYAKATEAQKQEEFCKQYVYALQDLFGNGSTTTYEMEKLRAYVDGYADPTARTFANTEGSGILFTVRGGSEDSLGVMKSSLDAHSFNKNSITLKDIHLEFTDTSGYVSIINTDIVVTAPEVKFTQSATMPDIFDFALIANKELRDVSGSMGTVKVNGSVYGGENGMTLHHDWEIKKANLIVTDDEVLLNGNTASLKIGDATVSDMPLFWAKSLKVQRASTTNSLDIYAKSYIADDLALNSAQASVKLTGEYYGYGNSLTDSNQSSSIVVNGINTYLDLSGLDSILLAGHSYIGTASAVAGAPTPTPGATPDPYAVNYLANEDIMMGESIAIKGEQIAYLVPDECIGVLDGVDVYGRNPMSAAEYEALQTKLLACDANGKYTDSDGVEHTLTEIAYNKPISTLGNPISTYTSTVKKVFYPSNGETLVYYYLVMDETQANQYFADYYGVHKDKVDQYFDIYTYGIKSNNSFTRINTQGGWLSNADAPTDVSKLNPAQNIDVTILAGEASHYTDMFEALKAKLITNFYEVSLAEKANSVYQNVIIQTGEDTTLDAFMSTEGGDFTWATDDGIKAYITYGDCNYSTADPKLRLIVAGGDVTVSADFTGLIVANGTVTVNNGVTLSNASDTTARDELTRVLQQPAGGVVDACKPIDFFRNGSNYILAGTVVMGVGVGEIDLSQDPIDFSEIVRYDNWSKQ